MAAGVIPSNSPGLSHGARPDHFEPRADFAGEAGQGRVIDRLRDHPCLVAAEGVDILGLAIEIDRIFGIDFHLRGGFGRDVRELGPDRPQAFYGNLGQGQKLESGPALSVEIDLEPVPRCLIGGEVQSFQKPARAA